MKDLNTLIVEKFKNKDFEKKYHRTAAYYRLADELLLLRKKRGLTQKELAEKSGTTQAVVSRMENASVKPSIETVLNFTEALDAVLDIRLTPIEDVRRKADKQKYLSRIRNVISHSSLSIYNLEKNQKHQSTDYFYIETQNKNDLASSLFNPPATTTKKEIEYA